LVRHGGGTGLRFFILSHCFSFHLWASLPHSRQTRVEAGGVGSTDGYIFFFLLVLLSLLPFYFLFSLLFFVICTS
jgi:hypothetical protein